MKQREVTTVFTFEVSCESAGSSGIIKLLLSTIREIGGVTGVSHDVGGTGLEILRVTVTARQARMIRLHKKLVSEIKSADGIELAGVSYDGEAMHGQSE